MGRESDILPVMNLRVIDPLLQAVLSARVIAISINLREKVFDQLQFEAICFLVSVLQHFVLCCNTSSLLHSPPTASMLLTEFMHGVSM